MKTLKTTCLLLLATFTLVGCGNATNKASQAESAVASQAEQEQGQVIINLVVDGQVVDGGHQELDIVEGKSLLDLMKEHYDIKEKDGFIESINGHEQKPDEKRYWVYTINGSFAEKGANEYFPKAGDKIKFSLSKL